MADIIERFSAKNYGCLKDVSVALTPLHAFIGPNDSGKSTLLRGIRTIVQFAGNGFVHNPNRTWYPFDPGLLGWADSEEPAHMEIALRGLTYQVCRGGAEAPPMGRSKAIQEELSIPQERPRVLQGYLQGQDLSTIARGVIGPLNVRGNWAEADEAIARFLGLGARMLRLDPDALRTPSKLIKSNAEVEFEDDTGRGLASIYDVILNQHMDGFVEIRNNLRELFPSVRSLGLENMSESTKEVRIQINTGEWIPARFMSEGMMYYLAFEALRFLRPRAVLLIEEPENGLHPARIIEVMKVLREISKTTQVILATHSPLVINELQPEEVSVVTRNPETGTKVTPMKETANFEKRSTAYSLGELWLSFADGVEEAPLLQGRKAQ